MRDDLHKKAPVPTRVQQLMKLALREADRAAPDRLAAAARAALEQAVHRGCCQDTLNRVAGRIDQGELFGPAVGRQTLSPMESEIIAALDCHLHGPQPKALRAGLASFADSWVREIRATLVADGTVYDLADVMSAVRDALDTAGNELIRIICTNEAIARTIAPLDLGDNLLPPGWSAR